LELRALGNGRGDDAITEDINRANTPAICVLSTCPHVGGAERCGLLVAGAVINVVAEIYSVPEVAIHALAIPGANSVVALCLFEAIVHPIDL